MERLAGACPLCGRTLHEQERAAWEWNGWRRGDYAGCERCLPEQKQQEVLFYEVWEVPELWDMTG